MLQLVYKVIKGNVVYIFNPCHVACLLVSYVLINKRTELTCNIFNSILSSWVPCGVAGIVFADVNRLLIPGDKELFFIEHYIIVLGVVVLFISRRYKAYWYNDIRLAILGFAWLTLYSRIVCYLVSEISWANINYALCAFDFDPIYVLVGDWFFLIGDFYIGAFFIAVRYVY